MRVTQLPGWHGEIVRCEVEAEEARLSEVKACFGHLEQLAEQGLVEGGGTIAPSFQIFKALNGVLEQLGTTAAVCRVLDKIAASGATFTDASEQYSAEHHPILVALALFDAKDWEKMRTQLDMQANPSNGLNSQASNWDRL